MYKRDLDKERFFYRRSVREPRGIFAVDVSAYIFTGLEPLPVFKCVQLRDVVQHFKNITF